MTQIGRIVLGNRHIIYSCCNCLLMIVMTMLSLIFYTATSQNNSPHVDMLLVFFNVACLGVKQYTISIVFALTWLDKKPAIFYTEGKDTHNYNTMAVWCVQVNLPRIHCNHIFFTNLEWIWSTDIQRRLIKSKTGIINRKWLTVSMF